MGTPFEDVGSLIDPGPLKWYKLEWQHVSGAIAEVDSYALESIAAELNCTAIGDHCYNPDVVWTWSIRNKVHIAQHVLERLLGRWMLDHDNWEPTHGWE